MKVYKLIPLTQATERQVHNLDSQDLNNCKSIVADFVTYFKAKHMG